jgi:hypothetical protein
VVHKWQNPLQREEKHIVYSVFVFAESGYGPLSFVVLKFNLYFCTDRFPYSKDLAAHGRIAVAGWVHRFQPACRQWQICIHMFVDFNGKNY